MPADRKPNVHATSSSPKEPKPRTRNSEQKRQQWTPAEDRIFAQLVADVARPLLWAAVQADGRLAHKTNGSIHSHLTLLLGKGAGK
ncbi:uncharacterized protein LOC62_03G004368 [Vanrija pseudolonga]|uniref:Uncharacterized protein n=1 Tax=Vanrija pseudolonga TaxID=143232 RepID=A0AAF0Y643_9TREE|nr:hypothetical protein LOC62_03G004368 [Vanrija pseudolonga]